MTMPSSFPFSVVRQCRHHRASTYFCDSNPQRGATVAAATGRAAIRRFEERQSSTTGHHHNVAVGNSSSWKSRGYLTAAAVAVVGTASWGMLQQKEGRLSIAVSLCEDSPFALPSDSFHLLAALDAREEMEKVRLAHILHDLHSITKERGVRLRRYVTMAKRRISEDDRDHNPDINNTRQTEGQETLEIPSSGEKSQQKHSSSEESQHKYSSNQTCSSSKMICLEGLDWSNLSHKDTLHLLDGISAGCRLDVDSLLGLIKAATERLAQEENLIDLSSSSSSSKLKSKKRKATRKENEKEGEEQPTISVVGDLHGSMRSLNHILHKTSLRQVLYDEHENIDDKRKRAGIVIFDGDFVDRGPQSLEVLLTLVILKLAYPDRVYLIRGNHEDVMVASVYGFQDEIRRKYGGDGDEQSDHIEQIWSAIAGLFAALPLAVHTPTAFVVHGGLPNDLFDLQTLRDMPKEVRLGLQTTVSPKSDLEKLLCGLLWSDPSTFDDRTDVDATATLENPRGLGVLFGTGVADSFLQKHNLLYLVRGHQVVAGGVLDQPCSGEGGSSGGGGTSVITVFSAAAYPGGTGSNEGAVLHMHPNGRYETETYTYRDIISSKEEEEHEATDHAIAKVQNLIGCHRSELERAFRQVQTREGTVSIEQWVEVMSNTIASATAMPWRTLQSILAPTSFWTPNTIYVGEFLKSCSLRLHQSDSVFSKDHHHAAETLAEHQEMLLTVFKFLDIDGDGTLSFEEFRTGIELLNKRLPKERHLLNAVELFEALDEDGNGVISFEEFRHGFGMN